MDPNAHALSNLPLRELGLALCTKYIHSVDSHCVNVFIGIVLLKGNTLINQRIGTGFSQKASANDLTTIYI